MKILVVKFGTETLMNEGRLASHLFARAAHQVLQLQKVGIQALIVSSGSIQAGRERLMELGRDPYVFSKKTLAGIGSRPLLNKWSEAFAPHTDVGQLWVTYRNWQDTGERTSIETEAGILLTSGLVPVVNENDPVSDEELRKYEQGIGENDQLARMVAELVGAEAILFVTSTGGVYETDPTLNPNAKLLSVVDHTLLEQLSLFGKSSKGTGGMRTKVREALLCAEKGIRSAIAGLTEDSILRFGRGEHVGTLIR
ncbi:MAG: hypothetical protein HYU04_02590 [Candidatus Wildermuthbacteria bacterium]|nr:hypothetical protein [Candidatus Wildermuthbacteria bacterium]